MALDALHTFLDPGSTSTLRIMRRIPCAVFSSFCWMTKMDQGLSQSSEMAVKEAIVTSPSKLSELPSPSLCHFQFFAPRQTAMAEFKLLYALVGEGRRISALHVHASDSVDKLVCRIVEREGLIPATCPASLVHLYLAKQDGDLHGLWLEEGEDELEQLFQTDLPTHIQRLYLPRKLQLKLSAEVGKYFPDESFTDGLPENPIHLLVDARPLAQRAPAMCTFGMPRSSEQAKLDDTNATPSKRRPLRIQWTQQVELCPQLNFDDSDEIMRIPAHYLVNSGVVSPQPDADLLLYRRAALVDEWNEIQRDSVDSYARLWIIGAPGTGKSCGAYAFACGKVDRTEWNVIWIHFSCHAKSFRFVKFEGDVKSTRVLQMTTLKAEPTAKDVLNDLLTVSGSSRKTIVFYDGYQDNIVASEHVRDVLDCWQQLDSKQRRLVCVASLESAREKLKGRMPIQGRAPRSSPLPALTTARRPELRTVMKFHLVSWTLDEYIAAISHDEFFEQVQHNLHRTPAATKKLRKRARSRFAQDLVKEKYFVAGGSARFMFTQTTAECIEDLEEAESRVGNFGDLFRGDVGEKSANVVNTLLAHYFNPGKEKLEHRIVSDYAAGLLALRLGPNAILDAAKVLIANPAMKGHAMEWWVLSSVSQSVGLSYWVRGSDTQEVQWASQDVSYFDPTATSATVARCVQEAGWRVPMKWNQAGYDAVFLERRADGKSHFCFVQITRAKTHSFKPGPFEQSLRKLKAAKVSLASVELMFVVPRDLLAEFKLPVSSADFKKNVINPVFSRKCTIESQVRVVGVECPIGETNNLTRFYEGNSVQADRVRPPSQAPGETSAPGRQRVPLKSAPASTTRRRHTKTALKPQRKTS